ncbi:SDR family oxidoreductase [Novosphingobium sp. JCM 18896]|uniref:SDR family oxidoreductase n=1 Tax=Novosphingobium sp. JCM 18896 TaxID=2989731 RepID=UPI002222B24A|nr:SDR family oxidoreductase [Novosphingobium sp. JCM 18896]MCW1430030.1 SDR family oxidoreductase [Novosphingobium sp. JCM 18896]
MLPAVLVTGGARRIGAIIARTFGQAGWHVVIHHKDSHDEAEALAATLPSAEIVQCDLADIAASASLIEELVSRLDDWRVLVNSAAVFNPDTAQDLDPAIFHEAVTVNAATPARMAQVFLAKARSKTGRRVIDLTDMKIANPNPDFFSYTMAKHAFASTVRMMAMAQADPADRVYGLAPGAMLPSFDQAPEEHLTSGRMNLLQRLTDPQELAQAALFLAEGWLASGETLFVDSGQHLLAQPRDVLFLARE